MALRFEAAFVEVVRKSAAETCVHALGLTLRLPGTTLSETTQSRHMAGNALRPRVGGRPGGLQNVPDRV